MATATRERAASRKRSPAKPNRSSRPTTSKAAPQPVADELHDEAVKAGKTTKADPAAERTRPVGVVVEAGKPLAKAKEESMPLTSKEQRHFQALERKIEQKLERGDQAHLEAGQALQEVRDKRLFRDTHRTFDAYCEDRWGFSSSRARQLCIAYRAVTAGNAKGATNERQVRALARAQRGGGAESTRTRAAQRADLKLVPEGKPELADVQAAAQTRIDELAGWLTESAGRGQATVSVRVMFADATDSIEMSST